MSDEQKLEELRSHMILCTSALLEAMCAFLQRDNGKEPGPAEIVRRVRKIQSELPSP